MEYALSSFMISAQTASTGRGDVFDRPLYLAGVLDNAADELKQTWFGYEWNDRTRCNCGIVARLVMQTDATKLNKLLPPIFENGVFCPTWSAMTESYCPDSGLPRNEVFCTLLKAGLRRDDFTHLEELSDPSIRERMSVYRQTQRPVRRSRKTDVIAYLRAWAVGIEAFHDRKLSTPRLENAQR
jgi:hypothetical protein